MSGDKFKTIRLYLGMNQTQFAEFLGVAQATIAMIESGKRRVSDAVAARLSHKFIVTEEYMRFSENHRRIIQ
ncbi:helix-turn-helix transcriptional regulator [Terribacillus sp. 179-K 1B1 HS]|uniref:helix-turn-helix domain-containing protein n=1 Tax=Terribacillus sp. 179-K 1B1 HS TaxID=3142388 RepID=UPI00399F92D4